VFGNPRLILQFDVDFAVERKCYAENVRVVGEGLQRILELQLLLQWIRSHRRDFKLPEITLASS
jgi:hypothetical protein